MHVGEYRYGEVLGYSRPWGGRQFLPEPRLRRLQPARPCADSFGHGSGRCASKPSMVLAKPLSRILYVDDDASMRELVRTALAAQSDFSVVTCASGFEALIIIGQLRPDLILLDLTMPRLDGVATLECLRAMELSHHTPVVFVAAGLSPAESKRLQLAGAAEIIQIPFDAGALPELIRSIWSRIAE